MRTLLSPLSPPAGDLKPWVEAAHNRLRTLIERYNNPVAEPIQLATRTAQTRPSQDGIMMWDATLKAPVIAVDGVWKKVTLT